MLLGAFLLLDIVSFFTPFIVRFIGLNIEPAAAGPFLCSEAIDFVTAPWQ